MKKLDIASLARPLATGITQLGLEIPAEQQIALLRYIVLLHRWNRTYNLTAVREPTAMISRHLLDSLAVSPYLYGASILDVGSGPGLPGIPLAVTHPQRSFTLLDSNGKKTRFMRQAVLELELENVRVEQARIEALHAPEGFDSITARAFASLPDIVRSAGRLLRPGGRLLALKGRLPRPELEALDQEKWAVEVIPLQVPKLEGERHLVQLSTKSFGGSSGTR